MGFSTTLTSRCCRPCFSETMALTTRCCDSKFCQHVAGVGGVVVYLCTTLCIATLYGPILCCYDVFTCLMMLQWWEEQWASLCREAVRKIGAVFSDDGGVDPYVVPRPKSANVVEITYVHDILPHLTLIDSLFPWIQWIPFWTKCRLPAIDFSTLRMCSDKGKMLHFNGGVKPWTWQTNYADHKLPLCVTYLETWHLGGGKDIVVFFLLELWVDSGGCVSKLATSIDFCPWKQLFDKGFAQGGWGKRGRWWLILFDTPRWNLWHFNSDS